MFFYLIFFFWFFRQIKSILFWLYLWQLKEYHIGRFIDHFRTEKGKKIFLNKIFFLKILFLFFSLVYSFHPIFIFLLFSLYFLELGKFILDLYKKSIKKPIFTKKISFLFFLNILFLFFYPFSFYQENKNPFFWMIIFDLFSFAVVSGIVLLFQPLFALLRYQIIKQAIEKRKKFSDLIVIALTGSYGKTSTKEFLATILEEKFPHRVLKTKEHQNSEIAISQCILKELTENHKIFVVEMGAYNKGGIKLLAKIVQPKIAILTGVNEQHLALFGSMENLISAEGGKELIESLPQDGLVIFNGENEFLRKIYEETKFKKKIVGINKKSFDLWASNIKVKKDVLFFQIFSKTGEMADISVNLIGAQNVENLLLAISASQELGMGLREIMLATKKIKMEQGGIKLVKTEKFNFIDSTYSANPHSVISHLEYLRVWEGKKCIIMPCLIELGSASPEIHRKIGQKIGQICDLAIILTKERFKEIKEGAKEMGMQEENILFLEDPLMIFDKIKNFNGEKDIILLEGRLPEKIKEIFFKKM